MGLFWAYRPIKNGRRSGGEGLQPGFQVGRIKRGAKPFERVHCLCPGRPRRAAVSGCARDLAQLSQNFGEQQLILGSFSLIAGDSERGESVVVGSALALDLGATLQSFRGGQVVTASPALERPVGD